MPFSSSPLPFHSMHRPTSAKAEEIHGEVETTGGVCLDDEKNGRMAFQARGDYQNHAIGWLQRGYSPLALGLWYDFHEFGLHLGNVG